jgi:hypothetical protein
MAEVFYRGFPHHRTRVFSRPDVASFDKATAVMPHSLQHVEAVSEYLA